MLSHSRFFAIALATATALSAPAIAANAHIADALKHRENLSRFTDAMIATGVMDELEPHKTYTIFAPTNAAFGALSDVEYPCLSSFACKTELAEVLRNHIVAEPVTFTGPTKGAVFSIDKTNINLGKEHGEVRTAHGFNIVNRGQVIGGIICEIDGVITSAQERVNLTAPKYIPVKTEHKIIERTTVDKVFYAPDGTPDGMSKVTTYTTEPVGTVK